MTKKKTMKTTKKKTMMTKADRCRQCPATVEPGADLCPACGIELAHRVMAAEPEPQTLKCKVCKAPFSLIEARVLRHAKDFLCHTQSMDTPDLCWVCARLHWSVVQQCVFCDIPSKHQGCTFSV